MKSLKEQVDDLNASIDRRKREAAEAYASSTVGVVQAKVTRFSRLTYQFTSAATWIYQKMLQPVYRVTSAPAKWLWKQYLLFWEYYTTRDGKFSRVRAGGLLAGTIAFGYFLFMPLLGFFFDAGMYVLTVHRDERIFMTSSQEIYPGANEHQAQGCHSLPCSDSNAIYFRIRATMFNEVWSILHGRGLFFPDIVATIPLNSQCTITSYGVRIKLFMRGTDIYPDLLKTECRPVGVGVDGKLG
jgi:hypothetical protein